jgi:hypothetical protein
MNKFFFRKLRSKISKVNADFREQTAEGGFRFKRTKVNSKKANRRVSGGNTWNSRTMFLAISIFAVMLYSVAQLGIGVYLDAQSKQLNQLRNEEAYLLEENRDIDSKIANQQSKIRVELTAEEDLKMRKQKDSDLVRVSSTSISASLGN